MNKFYEIATDHYLPLSHDNNYLFNHYDRITNFLTFNIDQQYRNLLAKPIKSGYNIEWFSIYPNLVNAQGSEHEEFAYRKYYEFLEVIKQRIENFKSQRDQDAINWAEILEKVFNEQDNFIYTNGKDISIVWGWKFENSQIYKPALQLANPPIEEEIIEENTPIVENITEPIGENNEPVLEDEIVEDLPIDEPKVEEELPEEIIEKEDEFPKDESLERKPGFLEFLKWFAGTYWWFLIILLVFIVLIFVYKSFLYS